MERRIIGKRKSHAFGKDVYLLGVDRDNEYVWLEAPSWDCGWYWGFGYCERYTNTTRPDLSKDIRSHTHINSEFKCNLWNYNWLKTTFDEKEGKQLSELFNKFYEELRLAEREHRRNREEWSRINNQVIPEITKQIIDILTPKEHV